MISAQTPRTARFLRGLSLALVLVFVLAGLPQGTSHNEPDLGHEKPGAPGAFYGNPFSFTFWGPQTPPISDPEPPCENNQLMDWESAPGQYPPNVYRNPNGSYQPPISAPHIGHVYGVQSIQKPFSWVEPGSTIDYHLMEYEDLTLNVRGWEGNQTGYRGPTIMLGPDGWVRFEMDRTIVDATQAPDLWVLDFHEHSSYCVYGRPEFDPEGPWMFIGTAFIESNYSFNGSFYGAKGSPLDLELYYSPAFQERYGVPGEDPLTAEVKEIMFVASLEKFPAARAFFQYDVTTDTSCSWPSSCTPGDTYRTPNSVGVEHRNLSDPGAPNQTYDYLWDLNSAPVIPQEQWVELEERAVRYGWPQRDDIYDNSLDPIIGWEWYIDNDPDPAVSTALVARDCLAPPCSPDFNFPNPYKGQRLPHGIYVDLVDPDTGEDWVANPLHPEYPNQGVYEVCLFVYAESALHPVTKKPMVSPGSGNPNSPSSDFRCQDIVVENLRPVAIMDEPNPPLPGSPDVRIRQFQETSYDPDGVPDCVDEYRWNLGDGRGQFIIKEDDFGHPMWPERHSPTAEYTSGGVKRIEFSVKDCNGGESDVIIKYIDIPPNFPPVFAPNALMTWPITEENCFTVYAFDPEGYPLDYVTHLGLKQGMTPYDPPITLDGFDVCWTPGQGDIGQHTFHFAAEDNLNQRTTHKVQVNVIKPDLDADGDGIYDFQDVCPSRHDRGQADGDRDGVGDECHRDSNVLAFYECMENGGTPTDCGLRFSLDPEIELGLIESEPGPRAGDTTPEAPRAALLDSDGDGLPDIRDNCPTTPNRGQEDMDGDRIGDLCDLDMDGDNVVQISRDLADILDNCPMVFNPDQRDSDKDGIGDACDQDTEEGRFNLASFSARFTAADCEDCEQAPLRERDETVSVMQRLGTQGVLGIVGGIVMLGVVSVSLSMWAVRRWKE